MRLVQPAPLPGAVTGVIPAPTRRTVRRRADGCTASPDAGRCACDAARAMCPYRGAASPYAESTAAGKTDTQGRVKRDGSPPPAISGPAATQCAPTEPGIRLGARAHAALRLAASRGAGVTSQARPAPPISRGDHGRGSDMERPGVESACTWCTSAWLTRHRDLCGEPEG
jgi:hypothetical protein